MAKIGTELFFIHNEERSDKLTFRHDISVSKDGTFSTMLPKDIIEKLKSVKINVHRNRLSNEGYLSSNTLEGLKKEVNEVCSQYFKSQVIEKKIVIIYSITTLCSYGMSGNDFIPNLSSEFNPTSQWKDGTAKLYATNRSPFGILVAVEIVERRTISYPNGNTAYVDHSARESGLIREKEKEDYNLKWLNGINSMSFNRGWYGIKESEIDYSPEATSFFVNLITSIFRLNEKIMPFLDSDGIKKLIEGNHKLLG